MELTPRYGDAPCLVVECDVEELRTAALRQRRRAVEAFGSLTDEQWNAQSRCDAWRVRDVVAHLVDTDGYWAMSLQAGVAGEPTRILSGFDPARTPAQLAAASADLPVGELHDRYAASVESLLTVLGDLDGADWSKSSEAPPGHIPISGVVHHALWDSWVHERDVFVPLGSEPPVEDDEVLACLSYVAGLGPSIDLGEGRSGALLVSTTEPDAEIVVEVGDGVRVRRGAHAEPATLRIVGDALHLAEMFSVRRPLDVDNSVDGAWLVAGLCRAFDQPTDDSAAR